MINEKDFKIPFLIMEARRWVGTTERDGDNRGQLVEMWQKTVDGKSQSESWCMAFVQAQLRWVDHVMHDVTGDNSFSRIFRSEHCLTTWNMTPKDCRSDVPLPGSIAIWRHKGTTKGHTGIVSSVVPSYRKFLCIEGNTGPGDGVVREGDGVYEKSRSMDGSGDMELLGFLIPWA